MIDALHIAASGLQRTESSLEASAHRSATGRVDSVTAAANQITSTRTAEAQADVVRTADDMVGTLLDLFA